MATRCEISVEPDQESFTITVIDNNNGDKYRTVFPNSKFVSKFYEITNLEKVLKDGMHSEPLDEQLVICETGIAHSITFSEKAPFNPVKTVEIRLKLTLNIRNMKTLTETFTFVLDKMPGPEPIPIPVPDPILLKVAEEPDSPTMPALISLAACSDLKQAQCEISPWTRCISEVGEVASEVPTKMEKAQKDILVMKLFDVSSSLTMVAIKIAETIMQKPPQNTNILGKLININETVATTCSKIAQLITELTQSTD
jgi:hypothetical protein